MNDKTSEIIIREQGEDDSQGLFTKPFANKVKYLCAVEKTELEKIFTDVCIETKWLVVPKSTDRFDFIDNVDINNLSPILQLTFNTIIKTRIHPNILTLLLRSRINCSAWYEREYEHVLNLPGIDLEEYYCNDIAEEIFQGSYYDELKLLFRSLWNISSDVSGCGVGKGEICLTFLCGLIKADVGDLYHQPTESVIEVKGTLGRIGSSKTLFAQDAYIRLAEIIDEAPSYFKHIVLRSIQKVKTTNKIKELIVELREIRELAKAEVTQKDRTNRKYELATLNQNKRIPKKLLNQAETIKKVKAFLNNIGTHDVPETGMGSGVGRPTLKLIKRLYNEIQQLKTLDHNEIVQPKHFPFRSAIKYFFLDYNELYYRNVIDDRIVDGFYACRNMDIGNDQFLKDFFIMYPTSLLKDENQLKKLIIALHGMYYWIAEGFDFLHAFNGTYGAVWKFPKVENRISTCNIFEKIYNSIPDQMYTKLAIGEGHRPTGVVIHISESHAYESSSKQTTSHYTDTFQETIKSC